MALSPVYINIIVFVFLSAIIFITLKVLNFFAIRLLNRQEIRSFWNMYFGVFELFVWLFFGLISIEYFSTHNKIIAIIIAVILTLSLIVIIYYYLKEVLLKIFFKLSTDIKVGDEVKNEKFAGRILQIKHNELIIEKNDGNQFGIPYSKIIFSPLIKQSPSPLLHRLEFNFTTPSDSDRNKIKQKIITSLLSDLRISGTVEPKVTFSDVNGTNYQIKVITFLFNSSDAEPIRESLKTVISA